MCAKLRQSMRKFRCLEDIVKFCYQPAKTYFETEKRTDNKIIYLLGMRMILEEVTVLVDLINASQCEPLKSLFDVCYYHQFLITKIKFLYFLLFLLKSFIDEDKFKRIRARIGELLESNALERLDEPLLKANRCFALKVNLFIFFFLRLNNFMRDQFFRFVFFLLLLIFVNGRKAYTAFWMSRDKRMSRLLIKYEVKLTNTKNNSLNRILFSYSIF